MSEGQTAVQIGKLLKRDTRTIKKAIENIDYVRKPRNDKGKCMLSKESIEMIINVAQKHPGMSSKEIFDIAGVSGVGKSLRCSILKKAGYVKNSFRRPSISVENISTESLENIKAIMQNNPHLSSKDIFDLAGVPDVGKTLRDQILEEFAGAVRNTAFGTGTVTNTARETGAAVTDNTDEIACITNTDVTSRVRLSEDKSTNAVATDNMNADLIIVKEELSQDNRKEDNDPLCQ